MTSKQVIWPNPVTDKLKTFRNERFTPEETYDFIIQLIIETEDLLLNPVLGRTYVEEFGEFKDYARIVIRKFKIYYTILETDIMITAVMFPGEC